MALNPGDDLVRVQCGGTLTPQLFERRVTPSVAHAEPTSRSSIRALVRSQVRRLRAAGAVESFRTVAKLAGFTHRSGQAWVRA